MVYCARPEDWIPGLKFIPLAKITGVLAFLGLVNSLGRTQRKFKDLPRESFYLLALIGVLTLSAIFSSVWRGGALSHTIDFAKVYVAWVLTFLLVTDFQRLRKIIYIQAVSVVVISVVSIIKGHSQPRLEGVIGGIYSNPNDLAFAIVLTVPFCLAFLLTAKSFLMEAGLDGRNSCARPHTADDCVARRFHHAHDFRNGRRLWHFGVRGRRLYLIVGVGFVSVLLMVVAGGPLMKRIKATARRWRGYETGQRPLTNRSRRGSF